MVMKVNGVNNIYFKAKESDFKKTDTVSEPKVTSLSSVTPDFMVNLPVSYKQNGIYELDNGLKVYSYKLSNGYKVSIVPMQDSPAVVKNYVNVGSMNETADIKGISHFLEHMAFNGTNGENGHEKLEVGDSFKKIEDMGGWANASTSYAVTDYVNSTPQLNKQDLETQIKVIAAMTEDLKLSDEMIEKEKKAVCSEIDMILDDPQTIALDQTVRTLFNINNPADEMVGGSVKHIKSLTRKDVVDYYNKYYTPTNMNLVITGDVDPEKTMQIVAKNFNSLKAPKGEKFDEKLVPLNKTVRKDFKNKNAFSTDIILGFVGPGNNETKNKVIHDVTVAYLESYASGLKKELKKYNAYPHIGCDKISTRPNTPMMTYIAASSSEENSEKVLHSLFKVISQLEKPSREQLAEIKDRIKKERSYALEYSEAVNEKVGAAVLNNDLEYLTEYNDILESITEEEVYHGIQKYFNLNRAAVTLVHPESKEISFKGKRMPINKENVSNIELENNFELGIYKTKADNINYNIQLKTDKPYNKKAGVIEVLNEIYKLGTALESEDELNRFKDKNNITLSAIVTPSGIKIYSDSVYKNRELMYDKAEELLYNPAINKKNLEFAKNRIKDLINRKRPSAYNLYANYEVKNNPYEFSDKEVLENLDNITVEDLKSCHKYLLENSRGMITANVPYGNLNIENEIINVGNKLDKVSPNRVELTKIYSENNIPIVLTQVSNNAQADIMQVHKFKLDGSIKESILCNLVNSILTNSSIGLFNVLREKEHLAYSVYSDINKLGDCGEISCNILTTTDNKDTGEFTYDNVKKSIDGFNHQINELKSGNFTDNDVANAKLALKAKLLNNEGTDAKLAALNAGMNTKYGVDYFNKVYQSIDEITKDDIVNFAQRIFNSPPTYSIVASKDTLENNKEYLESLEI